MRQLRFGYLDRSGSDRDQRALRTVVDCEKRIARFYATSDLHIDLRDNPGDLRADGDVFRVRFNDSRACYEAAIRRLRRRRYGRSWRERFVRSRRDQDRQAKCLASAMSGRMYFRNIGFRIGFAFLLVSQARE